MISRSTHFGLIIFFFFILYMSVGCGRLYSTTEKPNVAPDSEQNLNSQLQKTTTLQKEERVALGRQLYGEYYAKRIELFFDDNTKHPAGGIVLLGDSITQGFPLESAFPHQNVINRGIGGDSIKGVTDRLDISIIPLAPSRIYLMIGINNIVGSPDVHVGVFAEQYKNLLEQLKYAAPSAEICVFSILPVSKGFQKHNARVNELNIRIKSIVENMDMQWINVHDALVDEHGLLRSSCTFDGVHLSIDGYLAWLESFLPEKDYFDVMVNMATLWLEQSGSSFPISAVDPQTQGEYGGNRGPEQLIIYTSAYGKTTTGTNKWGTEAVIKNGIVQSVGGNNSIIPADGYVVSGHGKASAWISMNLSQGTILIYNKNTIWINKIPDDDIIPDKRLQVLKARIIEKLAALKASHAHDKQFQDVREVYSAVRSLESRRIQPSSDVFKSLLRNLNS